MDDDKTLKSIIEDACAEMCDKYCKYPLMPIPEGKDEDWLFGEDSPCNDCPLNKLC